MEIEVLGCAASGPVGGAACSGYLIRSGGTTLLVDCGPGVVTALTGRIPLGQLDAVLISHVHADHCHDLLALAWGILSRHETRADGTPLRIPVWVPRAGLVVVGGIGRSYGLHSAEAYSTEFYRGALDTREYDPSIPMRFGEIQVRLFGPTNHGAPCYAMRLEADGAAIAYSADSAVCGALVEVARKADLFLCESTSLDDPPPAGGGHLSVRQAAQIATEAGASSLIATHLLWQDDAYRESVAGRAREAFNGPLFVAQPGLRLVVPGETPR